MIKSIIYAVWFLSFTSCRTYHMLEGKSRPVYFTPDSSVFNDSDFNDVTIAYQDLQDLRGNFINVIQLKQGETSVAIIPQPTFFLAHDDFLVYPGERIIIKKGKYYDFTFIKKHGTKRRNRELSFFKTFRDNVKFPVIPHVYNASLDTILDLERKLKSQIPQYVVRSHQLFDSLTNACRVSKKFKKIAGDFLENRYYLSLYGLYQKYRDTLQANGLFKEKCKQLIPVFNAVTKKSKFKGITVSFNEIANEVLPNKIWRIENETEFKSCFDSIASNFTALAKDYLLSRLIYRAYTKRITISSNYIAKFETECSDKTYKKLIYNLRSQQEENDNRTTGSGNSNLLSVDGKTIASLENIITKHRGKLILIDFWATWCAPCREEMPHMKKLLQEYSKDKIVLLNISIEREIQPWQKYVIANNTGINNHYLMIDQEESSFIKQYGINSIPRYMMVDKEGQIINPEAPNPSDLKLKELIDKNLK